MLVVARARRRVPPPDKALVGQDLIERELSPQEVGVVAGAFSAHLRTSHDEVMGCVARYLEREAQLMEVDASTPVEGGARRLRVCGGSAPL